MPTAQVLHCLSQPPQATPPDPLTVISATAPSGGIVTTSLLDPAVPAIGSTQVVREFVTATTLAAGTYTFILSRFLTRMLPAQTVSAGTWKIGMVLRNAQSTSITSIAWSFCVAQWRPGTGVIARLVDGPSVPTWNLLPNVVNGDLPVGGSLNAGGSTTLTAGDCLVLEIWIRWINSASQTPDVSLLLNGLGQYYATGGIASEFGSGKLTDTDAVLVAPTAITFS